MELLPNNHTLENLTCWATKLLEMTGVLLSMPEGEKFDKKLSSGQKKLLECWKGFEMKKAFYLDLYLKSGKTDATILDKHEDCRIWMERLFRLLQRLKALSSM